MAEQIRIQTPFTEEMSRKLKAGDAVLISGTIIAARDAAHKAMTEALGDYGDKVLRVFRDSAEENPGFGFVEL